MVAAAVILPENFHNEILNDSKQLTEKQREQLRPIIEKEALAWAVAFVDEREIEEVNILNASIIAMHRALDQLATEPQHIIVDGNRFKPYNNTPHHTIVKGDSKYLSIAAASILAKTHRDEYMMQIAQQHPQYDWASNKGYPTKRHREAIALHGTTQHHRATFRLLPENQQLTLNI